MPQRILASLKSLVNKRKYLIELQFSLHKCPKPSWQGFRPPQNQANAHLILANSSLKKCPKPSGQGSRPPPPLRAMPKCLRHEFEDGFPKQVLKLCRYSCNPYTQRFRPTDPSLGVRRSVNNNHRLFQQGCFI